MSLQVGDMFLIHFPFDQNPMQGKRRPVILLRDLKDGTWQVAPITGTNLTGKKNGLWILKDSKNGLSMRLAKDSFILCDKVRKWPSFGFIDYWGQCPCVEELLAKFKGKK